jgi:hypothetical protein
MQRYLGYLNGALDRRLPPPRSRVRFQVGPRFTVIQRATPFAQHRFRLRAPVSSYNTIKISPGLFGCDSRRSTLGPDRIPPGGASVSEDPRDLGVHASSPSRCMIACKY